MFSIFCLKQKQGITVRKGIWKMFKMIFCTVKCADSQNDMIKTLGVYCEKKKTCKARKTFLQQRIVVITN